MRLGRILLALGAVLALDWAPGIPPFPVVGVAQVKAQIIPPPNQWHPYRGGTNCVQVADVNGNFSCSPLVTINPLTGAFNSVLGGPISQAVALVVGPSGNTFQALGNDLVLATSPITIAQAGPSVGGATIRVRPSPFPGYCRLVIAGGNTFGKEFPVALLNPLYPFPQSGLAAPVGIPLTDAFQVDFPCGPS